MPFPEFLFSILAPLRDLLLQLGGVLYVCVIIVQFLLNTPVYRAVDHDPRLTSIARTAVPYIAAIDRYFGAHGICPPAGAADLPHEKLGWQYRSQGAYCGLWIKLGWDPSLGWSRESRNWVYEPGDGTEAKTIRLDVGMP